MRYLPRINGGDVGCATQWRQVASLSRLRGNDQAASEHREGASRAEESSHQFLAESSPRAIGDCNAQGRVTSPGPTEGRWKKWRHDKQAYATQTGAATRRAPFATRAR